MIELSGRDERLELGIYLISRVLRTWNPELLLRISYLESPANTNVRNRNRKISFFSRISKQQPLGNRTL